MIWRSAHRFVADCTLVPAALSVTTRKSRIFMMSAVLWLCASGSLAAQTFTTVFSFDAGAARAAVNILDTSLAGATSRTFNGTAAEFTVVSSFEITTTVPSGATTGEVEVVAPSGKLSSNVSFRVP
jgi:hypothetical protein